MLESLIYFLKEYINYSYNLDSTDRSRDLASRVVKEESKFIPNGAINAKPCPFSAPTTTGRLTPPSTAKVHCPIVNINCVFRKPFSSLFVAFRDILRAIAI